MTRDTSWVHTEWVKGDPSIPGMFDFGSTYDFLVEAAPSGSILVEIGVFHGRSLVYLSKVAAAAQKELKVVGVDWGQGCGIGDGYNANGVLTNLRGRGLETPLIFCNSWEAAEFFPLAGVFAAFIDADHTEAAVRRDIAAWAPRIEPGGYLAGHDYDHPGCTWNPDVKKVVDEIYGPGVGHKPIPGCWMVQL